jgi:hypothetical protein
LFDAGHQPLNGVSIEAFDRAPFILF